MTHFRFPPDPALPVPRAQVDPIIRPDDALAVIALATTVPLIDETIVLVLDDLGCGSVVTAVTGTCDPDDVVAVVNLFAAALQPALQSGLIVASIRSSPAADINADDDADRWLRLEQLGDEHGVIMHDWFVIDQKGATRARDLVGGSSDRDRRAARPLTDVSQPSGVPPG